MEAYLQGLAHGLKFVGVLSPVAVVALLLWAANYVLERLERAERLRRFVNDEGYHARWIRLASWPRELENDSRYVALITPSDKWEIVRYDAGRACFLWTPLAGDTTEILVGDTTEIKVTVTHLLSWRTPKQGDKQ